MMSQSSGRPLLLKTVKRSRVPSGENRIQYGMRSSATSLRMLLPSRFATNKPFGFSPPTKTRWFPSGLQHASRARMSLTRRGDHHVAKAYAQGDQAAGEVMNE